MRRSTDHARPSSARAFRGSRTALIGAVALSVLAGCSTPTRGPAVPLGRLPNAVILGNTEGLRYFPQKDQSGLVRVYRESAIREIAYVRRTGKPAPRTASFLAISGGGSDGAFGVGVLVGWTEHGDRPEFKVVTGISTGSLIAPFAFLGSKYDPVIKEFYTNVDSRAIFRQRGLIGGLLNDALTDNQPLRVLVRKVVTAEVMAAVAREYKRGRLLFIGTTNLDAKIPVYWDMGAIASLGTPEALRLFQEVMIASTAAPVVFPPVMIDVVVAGKRYQEMHVDGGAISQLFLYPPSIELGKLARTEARRLGVRDRKRRAYVIRNAKLGSNWASVKRSTMNIAGEAVSALIAAQGENAIKEVYFETRRDGVDFNLAYIPDSFTRKEKKPFEKAYMRALYQVGYDLARKGYPWSKAPPGFSPGSR